MDAGGDCSCMHQLLTLAVASARPVLWWSVRRSKVRAGCPLLLLAAAAVVVVGPLARAAMATALWPLCGQPVRNGGLSRGKTLFLATRPPSPSLFNGAGPERCYGARLLACAVSIRTF